MRAVLEQKKGFAVTENIKKNCLSVLSHVLQITWYTAAWNIDNPLENIKPHSYVMSSYLMAAVCVAQAMLPLLEKSQTHDLIILKFSLQESIYWAWSGIMQLWETREGFSNNWGKLIWLDVWLLAYLSDFLDLVLLLLGRLMT